MPRYIVTETQEMVSFPAGTRVFMSVDEARPLVEAGVLCLEEDRELDPSEARQRQFYNTRVMRPEAD